MDEISFEPDLSKGITTIRTIEYLETVSSTNDRLKELLKQPVLPNLPYLLVAEHQTAGRGRGGKSWWSGRGALFMSLAFEWKMYGLSRNDSVRLSLAAGFAVRDAVAARISKSHETEIHLPNDVYVDGKKISGILIESPSPKHVVVGIGVNVNNRTTEIPAEFREELEKRSIISLIDLLGHKTEIFELIVDILMRFHYKLKIGKNI